MIPAREMLEVMISTTEIGEPWALARFNDGEMMAVASANALVSRGHQRGSESLQTALVAALRFRRPAYYIGLPCSRRWPGHRQAAVEIMGDETYPGLTSACCTSNANWGPFVNRFGNAIRAGGRRVIWVGGGDAGCLPFPIERQIPLPERDAWDRAESLAVPVMADRLPRVVLVSCGPASRVLVHRWYAERPDWTVIDIGSVYDPWVRDVAHPYQQTDHPVRCEECLGRHG